MSSYYIKRIAVLKQLSAGYSVSGKSLSGIIKVEKNGGQATVRASLINIAPLNEGGYAAAISGTDGRIYSANLGQNPTVGDFALNGVPEIEDGLAALIVFTHSGKTVPVAYGSSGSCRADVNALKSYFDFQNAEKTAAPPAPSKPEAEKAEPLYDDEVVASENYFLNENTAIKFAAENKNFIISEEILDYETANGDDFRRKDERNEREFFQEEEKAKHPFYVCKNENAVPVVKEQSCLNGENGAQERTFFSPENASEDASNFAAEKSRLFDESYFESGGINTQTETTGKSDSAQFEFEDTVFGEEKFSAEPFGAEQGDYYQKVKDELRSLLNTYPKEIELIRSVPDSDWVKIDYSGGKHYAVGIIYSGERPAYICYGVPAKSSANPPEELKGYCSYLPTGGSEDGYWMMYQDARTGECAEVNYI